MGAEEFSPILDIVRLCSQLIELFFRHLADLGHCEDLRNARDQTSFNGQIDDINGKCTKCRLKLLINRGNRDGAKLDLTENHGSTQVDRIASVVMFVSGDPTMCSNIASTKAFATRVTCSTWKREIASQGLA
jgi:hypothetical protein